MKLMKKYYVTFGQDHRHVIDSVVFDRDCIAVIEGKSYEDARRKIIGLFGLKFCFQFGRIEDVDISYYSRGFIPVKPV